MSKSVQALVTNTVWKPTALSIPADEASYDRRLTGRNLVVSKQGYTGSEVERVYTTPMDQDSNRPELSPLRSPGKIAVQAMLDTTPGEERTGIIERWAESVWQTWEVYTSGWEKPVVNR